MPIEIAIDLGTSKTVMISGTKKVLEEPSVVTVDTETREPISYGRLAKETIGRTPDSVTTVFPIEHGVIADYGITEIMLKEYMQNAFGNHLLRPRVIISVPTGVTAVQHRSVARAVEIAGGRNVCTIESVMADAIGLGIDFKEPRGSMVVDIGAGTTDIATMSMGGLAVCSSVRTASNDFDEAIIRYIRREFNVLVGKQTAENLKIQLGSVVKRPVELTVQAKGRNLFTGLPQIFEISSSHIYEAIIDTALSICAAVKSVMEKSPPDIVADISTDGIHLTGGGALIYGMPDLIAEYMHTGVNMAVSPKYTVAKGAAIALRRPELLVNGDYQFRSIQELIVDE